MTQATRRAGLTARIREGAVAATVIGTALALGGCATNLTGFQFPSFGLTSKSRGADADQQAVPGYYAEERLSQSTF